MRSVLTFLTTALLVAGCQGGGKTTAPTGRNIATPNKMVGQGGLPPSQ